MEANGDVGNNTKNQNSQIKLKFLDFVARMRYIPFMSSPTSIRIGEAGLNLLVQLSRVLGLKRSAVIELALRELARKHKL